MPLSPYMLLYKIKKLCDQMTISAPNKKDMPGDGPQAQCKLKHTGSQKEKL